MADPRINKWASLLIHYSLNLRPSEKLELHGSPLAEELTLAVYSEALKAGANILLWNDPPQAQEVFFKFASNKQLDYASPVYNLISETFDASLIIRAFHNTRALAGIDPSKQARWARAIEPSNQIFFERVARNEARWCYTLYPTNASAQDAEMSLADYQEFVYAACKLDQPNPIKAWQQEGERLKEMQAWLVGRDRVELKGPDIDLTFSIKERPFVIADGRVNFPDGEIFTSPVENSVNGWVRFQYPSVVAGHEIEEIELWFKNGKVVREKAAKSEEVLTARLNTDDGSRYLGEWGIGTNYDIPRFSKNILFDEKLGGTIHLALGNGYRESGGQNRSAIHWDMLCNMTSGEITIDGELFYRNGKPEIWN